MLLNNIYIIHRLCSIVDQRTLLTLSEVSDKWYQITKPYIDKCGVSNEISLNRQLELYCRNDNLIQLKKLIKAHANQLDWQYGLLGACAAGNLDLILLFKSLIDDDDDGILDNAFDELCQSKLNVATILRIKPTLKSEYSLTGLKGACLAGRLDLLKSLIALKSPPMDQEDWNMMFYCACKGGNQELIDYFIINGADDWNRGLSGASAGGHLTLVETLVDKILSNGAVNLSDALESACFNNQTEIVEYLCSFDPSCCRGLLGACRAGNLNLIKLMIEHGALENRDEDDLREIYDDAIESGKIEIVEYIDKILNIDVPDDSKLSLAVCDGNINLIKYYLKSKIEIYELNSCLDLACNGKDYDIMNLLIDAGATECDSCDRSLIDHRQYNLHIELDSYTILDILNSDDKHLIEIAQDISKDERLNDGYYDEFEEFPMGLSKEQISLSSDKPVGRRPTKLSSESSSRETESDFCDD